MQSGAFSDTNLVGRVLGDARGPRAGRGPAAASRRRRSGRCSTTNRHLVEALRDALLERHELIGTEITDVLEAAAARTQVPSVIDLRDEASVVPD